MPLTLECHAVAPRRAGSSHAARTTGTRRAGSARGKTSESFDAEPAAARDAPGGAAVAFVFEFDGDGGRVRYPATLTPVVHSGGSAGWWPIRDLVATDDAFSGRIALNFINRPHFTIDRRTGTFDLSGGIDAGITGRCARVDAGQRLF